jgi:hypothetical protein
MRPHGDVLGRLGGDLLGQQRIEEVGVRGLLGGDLLEQSLQALAALEQPQGRLAARGGGARRRPGGPSWRSRPGRMRS